MTDDVLGRTLPHNSEAEQALLGAIMLNENVLDDAIEIVKPSDFFRESHGIVYETMIEQRERGHGVDIVSIKDELSRKILKTPGGVTMPALERIGGAYYLLSLQDACPIASNWKQYAEIVHRDSVYRRMVAVGAKIASLGYEGSEDLEGSLGDASSAVMDLALDNSTESKSSSEVMKTFLANLHHGGNNYFSPPNVPWVRIRPDDLVVIGAGPSVGKTATALHWADEWSKTKKVTYFEYEMSEADLMTRLVCTHSGVTWEQIQDRNLSVEEVRRIEDATKELSTRSLRLQEVWCPVGTLLAKIRQEAQRGTEVIFIDHLGLIPFDIPHGMNLAKAYGTQVTGKLKRMASELKITIVLLVQISREGQKDGFPKLHHLRDSGEIEQDASIVFTLWSDKSIEDQPARKVAVRELSGVLNHQELSDSRFNLIRISAEKNRNGRLGVAWSLYHGSTFRYEERSAELPLFSRQPSQLFGEEVNEEAG